MRELFTISSEYVGQESRGRSWVVMFVGGV